MQSSDFLKRREITWPVLQGYDVDSRRPDLPERRTSTYAHWFRPPPGGPPYLSNPALTLRQRWQVARFRLNPLTLGALCRTQRPVPWPDRLCHRCAPEYRSTLSCAVDDEFHVVFECSAFAALREDVADLLPAPDKRQHEFAALFKHTRFCRFVAACMNLLGRAVGPTTAEQV